MSWTDHQVERLKAMHKQGMSASQIAKALGTGHSRNSVLAKLHRLGMLAGERKRVNSLPVDPQAFHRPSAPRRFSWEGQS